MAIQSLVKALLELRKAPYGFCRETYKYITGENLSISSPKTNIKKYVLERYSLAYNTGQSSPEIYEWLQPKIRQISEIFTLPLSYNSPVLVHGDTSEGNIFLTDQFDITLIDWEDGGFFQYPEDWDDYGIACLMNHVPVFQIFRNKIVAMVSKLVGVEILNLERRIHMGQERTKMGDVVWAFMKHARTKVGEIDGDPIKYLEIAKTRINEYEAIYS